MCEVSLADKFQFDTQGYVMLRSALSRGECNEFLAATDRLALATYDDAWLDHPLVNGEGDGTLQRLNDATHIRLNGLIRLDPVFDQLIDHPRILPYLRAFMDHPQLINTWSIHKTIGEGWGGWHRGVPQTSYSYHNGKINSRMINTIVFLNDTGSEDGCLAVLPGSHKANIDLDVRHEFAADKAPGYQLVPGSAGDVLIFSEALLHTGSPKLTAVPRTNLYFNYIEATYNPALRELLGSRMGNFHHYWLPPEVRQRFNETQQELTQWMEWMKWEHIEPALHS